ncbi:unnamed protein product [Blepharisma stoltei]|uniref:Major facilitator superfamily (MFS) profile domain-containing protein n=1 Tax=Blepharisma stoltei TaxID=1481888 RepID=A0AAU9IW10_9CILI|nr:unnamed protein product [Blepharisma stoltei]
MGKRNKINRILESMGWGKYQIYVFWTCFVTLILQTSTRASVAVIMMDSKENHPDRNIGILPSIMQLGNVIGCYGFGYFSNRFGRKWLFLYGDIITIIGITLTIVDTEWMLLKIGLFLVGVGTGSDMVLANSIAFESFPPSKRCKLGIMNCACSIGSITTFGIGLLTTQISIFDIPSLGIVLSYSLIIALILMIMRIYLMETPMYLCDHYEDKKLATVLFHIAQINGKSDCDNVMDTPMLENSISSEEVTDKPPTLKELFNHHNKRATIFLSAIYIFSSIATTSLTYFMPELLPNISEHQIYIVILFQSCCSMPGMVISYELMDTVFGRVYTIALGFLFTAITLFPIMYSSGFWIILIMSGINNMMSNVGFATLSAATPESFNTHIRCLSTGWLMGTSKVAGIIAPIVIGYLINSTGPIGALWLSLVGFVLASASSLALKETRPT